jgi:hypothetical protein
MSMTGVTAASYAASVGAKATLYDPGMDVRPVDDPERFLEESSPLLLEDEARHNLMLGLAGILASTPDVFPGFRLWTVREGDAIVGAALRTPPHNLVVADLDRAASWTPWRRRFMPKATSCRALSVRCPR